MLHKKPPIRIAYGNDPLQFGDLRIFSSLRPVPIIVLIHGGCWRSQYDLTLMDPLAEALYREGIATWNMEYRRTEDPGGGWPGTFLDVANGFKYLDTLASEYPIDLSKILVMGHSAGGHLALWLGAQNRLPKISEIKVAGLPLITGIISLAGIINLNTYLAPDGCGGNVINLIGGHPGKYASRYKEGTPANFLPLDIPQILIHGEYDDIVPLSHVQTYYDLSKASKDDIHLYLIPNASHRDVIDPASMVWPSILKAIQQLN